MEENDEHTRQLVHELAALGVDLTTSDPRISQLIRELAAEKAAQLEGAKAVLKPVTILAAIIAFILCFWRYEIGLLYSIGVALLIVPAIGVLVALPVGRILGKRAALRFKVRLRALEYLREP
jgi:hypothetical protein